MTIKEIAEKVLLVMDMREASFQLVSGMDRAGKQQHGEYTKTIVCCFHEVFGDELIYRPYYLAIYCAWNSMESWAKSVLEE